MRSTEKKKDLPSIPANRKQEGRYANFFQIGHNAAEFLLEFGQEEGRIHTRIYMSPQHAQILSDLLTDALKRHSERLDSTVASRPRNIQ
jgi:Protein of unknown function (DUF3467)